RLRSTSLRTSTGPKRLLIPRSSRTGATVYQPATRRASSPADLRITGTGRGKSEQGPRPALQSRSVIVFFVVVGSVLERTAGDDLAAEVLDDGVGAGPLAALGDGDAVTDRTGD